MDVRGGHAGFKSVSFHSENFVTKATMGKNQDIKVTFKVKNKTKKDRLDNIVFIRGICLLVKLVLSQWKLAFALLVISMMFAILSLMFGNTEASQLTLSSDTTNLIKIIELLILLFVFKVSDISKYHGAEHMTYKAFENGIDLSVKNILKQSRVHRSCGTNLAVFTLIVSGVFSLLNVNTYLLPFVSFSIAYEIFRLDEGVMYKLAKPVYWLGDIVQQFITTSKPSSKHVQVSKAAFEKLMSLENKED